MNAGAEPDPYVAARAREVLAKDPEVGGMHLEVEVNAGTITVSGSVGTAERRDAAARALEEEFPGYTVRNETSVTALGRTQTEEIT